jgi:hypothetical protein
VTERESHCLQDHRPQQRAHDNAGWISWPGSGDIRSIKSGPAEDTCRTVVAAVVTLSPSAEAESTPPVIANLNSVTPTALANVADVPVMAAVDESVSCVRQPQGSVKERCVGMRCVLGGWCCEVWRSVHLAEYARVARMCCCCVVQSGYTGARCATPEKQSGCRMAEVKQVRLGRLVSGSLSCPRPPPYSTGCRLKPPSGLYGTQFASKCYGQHHCQRVIWAGSRAGQTKLSQIGWSYKYKVQRGQLNRLVEYRVLSDRRCVVCHKPSAPRSPPHQTTRND